MSETKKKQIRKGIAAVEIALAAVLVIYLIYGVVTKNSNQLIFNILATILVAAAVVLNDIVEPYLTKVFEEMDEFRKNVEEKLRLIRRQEDERRRLLLIRSDADRTTTNQGGTQLWLDSSLKSSIKTAIRSSSR